MKKIITYIVKYPIYANIIIAVIVLVGGFSLLNMKRSFFPEMKSRIIQVSVSYPGASPKEMEEGVTTRIEEALRGIVGIKEITSTSSENYSSVSVETTGEYDIDETLMDVKNAVDGISSFPTAAEKPIVFKQRSRTQAAYMGLSGDVDLQTLKKYAQSIEDDFLASGIISKISIGGYPDLEISVETKEEDLRRYNLTFDLISAAIAANNLDISAGQIKSDEQEILILSRNRSVDPNKIGDIILRANEDGSFLRIRDIAKVKTKFADVTSGAKINGKQGIFFSIEKLGNEDLKEISEYLNAYVLNFNKKNESIRLDITFDFNSMLNSRLNLLLTNGGIGLILVIITLAFFLSFRLSLWVAWGIPSAFLAMFIIASMSGITINMISLFGMILVVGILVDDGIVIAENIYAHFEMGKSPKRAAIDGVVEVYPAIITSVTTTIVAFSPLLLLQGRMEMLYEMAFIVVFSLLFSLLEAFFVLPAHLSSGHILRRKDEKKSGNIRDKLDKVIYIMRDIFYKNVLESIIRWRWIVVTIPIALILITMGMIKGTLIKTTFFPTIAFDSFNVNVAFTPGSGEKRTAEYLERFEKSIWEVNEEIKEEFADSKDFVTFAFRSVGSAFDGEENGAHAGNINVLMRDMEGAPISTFDIAARVRDKIGEVPEASKFTVGGRNRWGSPIAISILGQNLEELELAKVSLLAELKNIPELDNVNDKNSQGKQEIQIQLKPKAYFLGLSQSEVAKQVRQGFYGGQVQRLQQGKDEIRVWVRYPKEDRINVGQFENMKIKTSKGEYSLIDLVTYKIERGPVNINRYNGAREERIDADLLDPFAPVPPILEYIQNEVVPKIKAHFPGVTFVYQGQAKDSAESFNQIITLFAAAFLLIVLILMLHFRSLTHMAIIVMMIPLSFLGAAWGHGLHGHPISIMSAWGMVALSGVVINDAVVFLARYNSLLIGGMKIEEAVFNAGISRYRAIILTTLTTVLGLYSIILETSFQAQFLIPMAISLAYGVLVGTGFILLFFPVLILTLNDTKVWLYKFWNGKSIEPEEIEPAIIHDKVNVE
ncbi:MAG: efflux RND transporter permease subunit [Bacteroidetes bacterium]|nr:efflux RND transporter permease subunit [Bacteroidota bacterium]MBU1116453.1 efflux RND transporter permease subunit [Bacteroidota bacterium]MBU1800033.1 efflux RND transporter permease subunit [Bacteroidota bacterium]